MQREVTDGETTGNVVAALQGGMQGGRKAATAAYPGSKHVNTNPYMCYDKMQ